MAGINDRFHVDSDLSKTKIHSHARWGILSDFCCEIVVKKGFVVSRGLKYDEAEKRSLFIESQ